MAARAFVKKDEELGEGSITVQKRVKTTSSGTPSTATTLSRKTILARIILLLVIIGSLVSVSMIAHFDTESGSWKLPEVSFSINDLLEWSDDKLGISKAFYPDGSSIDFHGHNNIDDDTIPLDTTGVYHGYCSFVFFCLYLCLILVFLHIPLYSLHLSCTNPLRLAHRQERPDQRQRVQEPHEQGWHASRGRGDEQGAEAGEGA